MKLDEHNNPLCGNCYGVLERGKLRHRDGVAHCPDCYEPVDTKRCTRCGRERAVVEFARTGAKLANGNPQRRSYCRQCQAAYDAKAKGSRRAKLRSYRKAYKQRTAELIRQVRAHGRSPRSATMADPPDQPRPIPPISHGRSPRSAMADPPDQPWPIPSISHGRSPVRDVTDVIPPRPKAKPAPASGPKPASVPQSYRASDWDPDKDPLDWADVPFVLLRDPRFDPSESSTWPDDDDPVWQGPNARRAGWC
jgi:hypothetical protein